MNAQIFPAGQRTRGAHDLAIVRDWLTSYIGRPHERIGRTGPVCPFVPPSLRSGALRVHIRYGVTGEDAAELRAIMRAEFTAFRAVAPAPAGPSASLDSVLVVLPDTGPAGWAGIDEAYLCLKEDAVGQGLMVGQFHPRCAEGAVRNPVFPVSRAPIGLYAVRHMAPHDILFLHDRPQWFAEYDRRFGAHFAAGKVRDAYLRGRYARARETFTATEQVPARSAERTEPQS